jgi:hypothetical protein
MMAAVAIQSDGQVKSMRDMIAVRLQQKLEKVFLRFKFVSARLERMRASQEDSRVKYAHCIEKNQSLRCHSICREFLEGRHKKITKDKGSNKGGQHN